MFDSTLTVAFAFVACLQVKHFIGDGPLQTLRMVKAKGFYGRSQGVLHAVVHGVGTLLVVAAFGAPLLMVAQLAILDTALHYHIDYGKERLVREQGWMANDRYFWWALTADQTLHHFSYLLIAIWMFKV